MPSTSNDFLRWNIQCKQPSGMMMLDMLKLAVFNTQ